MCSFPPFALDGRGFVNVFQNRILLQERFELSAFARKAIDEEKHRFIVGQLSPDQIRVQSLIMHVALVNEFGEIVQCSKIVPKLRRMFFVKLFVSILRAAIRICSSKRTL